MVRLAVLPDLAPGENTRGAASGAAWSYLLADRAPGTIVCLGVPTAATRAVLDGLGEVRVVPFGDEPARWRTAASGWSPCSIRAGPTG